jgi:hypothetical protein
MVNIYVVDDLGNRVKFYGTNQPLVFRATESGKAKEKQGPI